MRTIVALRGLPGLARLPLLITIAALGGVATLSGCTVDVQTNPAPAPAVGKDELARVLTEELVRRTGQQPDSINCPTDLPRTPGANVRCPLIQGGQQVGIVTATINDQGRISYNYDINAPAPTSSAPSPPSPGPSR